MPKQDWSINTKPAAAGDMYGIAATNSQRLTYNIEEEMTTFGVAVVQGSTQRTCKAGQLNGQILGITMRQLNREAAKRPSDGSVLLPAGTPLTVTLEGGMNVKLKTAITGEKLGVNAKGEFGSGAGFTEVTNVRAIQYPAAAGDVIGVLVMLVPTAAPAPAPTK